MAVLEVLLEGGSCCIGQEWQCWWQPRHGWGCPHCPLPQSSPRVLGATKAGTPLRPGLPHARTLTGGPERNCSVPGALGGGFVSAASNELPTSPSIRASGWGRWRDPSCQSPSHYISLGGARGFFII